VNEPRGLAAWRPIYSSASSAEKARTQADRFLRHGNTLGERAGGVPWGDISLQGLKPRNIAARNAGDEAPAS